MCGRALSCSKTTPALIIPRRLFWMTRHNFWTFSQQRSIFTVSLLVSKSTRRMPHLTQNIVHITFRAYKVSLNFVSQVDPLWHRCIDRCLISGVFCAIHVSSPVTFRYRNSSPSSYNRCRNVNPVSLRYVLCSGVSYFGTHLVHNFLNNRCSVTIFCNKEREICGKWLFSSVILKRRFSITHSCTSYTTSSVMRVSSYCTPHHAHFVGCKLSAPDTHHLLAHKARPTGLAQLTMNFDRR